MTTCYEIGDKIKGIGDKIKGIGDKIKGIGDKIKGYKILCEARQIKPPKSNTKNWKTQSTTNSIKR